MERIILSIFNKKTKKRKYERKNMQCEEYVRTSQTVRMASKTGAAIAINMSFSCAPGG